MVLPAPSGPEDEEMVRVRRAPSSSASAAGPRVEGPRRPTRCHSARNWPPRWPSRGAGPSRQLFHLLRGAGLSSSLLLGLVLTAGGTVFEGLLLRGVLDIGRDLQPGRSRRPLRS